MKDLQRASDDVCVIAETVETLGKLLDRFHAQHGEKLYEQVFAAFPEAHQFGGGAHKELWKLSLKLIPPEE